MKDFAFTTYEDMTNIVDSMQMSSGTIIADLVSEKIDAYIIVHGEVNVNFEGVSYTDPLEFPDALKELIVNDRYWDCDERVDVRFNNWFEVVVNDGYDAEVVYVEGASTEELYSALADAVNTEIDRGVILSEKVSSTLSEFIKNGGKEYQCLKNENKKNKKETIELD